MKIPPGVILGVPDWRGRRYAFRIASVLPVQEQTGSLAEAQSPPPARHPKDTLYDGNRILLAQGNATAGPRDPFQRTQINESSHTLLRGIKFLLTKQSSPCNLKIILLLFSSTHRMQSLGTTGDQSPF